MTQVFVYGTLKPGEVNDWVYRQYPVVAAPAIAYGHLYHLPLGYPALTIGGDRVHGFLLTFGNAHDNAQILDVLDQFEQHDPAALRQWVPDCRPENFLYQRQLIAVFQPTGASWGQAWVYTMTLAQVQQLGGKRITQGIWRSAHEYMD